MNRKTDLEKLILDSYNIVRRYEASSVFITDPLQSAQIDFQRSQLWKRISIWRTDYLKLCSSMGYQPLQEIVTMAIDPLQVAPFVPVIVEATKFVLGEVSKWIDELRQKRAPTDSIPKQDLKTAENINTIATAGKDERNLLASIDNYRAEANSQEISGLMNQLRLHKRNLTDLESQAAMYAGMAPMHVLRQIEHEESEISSKSAHLIHLLANSLKPSKSN